MGTRMEKYNKSKKDNKNKKFKKITLIFLTMFLILELNMLDTRLRNSTNTEASMYSVNFNENTLNLELLGNKHHLSRVEVARILENLKERVKSIKDQISLVF